MLRAVASMTCCTCAPPSMEVAIGLATTPREEARSPGRVRAEEKFLRGLVDLLPKNTPIRPVYGNNRHMVKSVPTRSLIHYPGSS